jgi:hypothetical protein
VQKKNNMTFSSYTKELVCIGQEKKIYDLPEAICRIWKLSRQDFSTNFKSSDPMVKMTNRKIKLGIDWQFVKIFKETSIQRIIFWGKNAQAPYNKEV